MFMKHYAPNRCLYIKESTGGGSWGGGGGQDGCERRTKNKSFCGSGRGGGRGSGWGDQGRCEQRSKVFVKIEKKIMEGVGLGGGGVRFWGARVDVDAPNRCLYIKESTGGGGGGGASWGGAGWM